MKDFIIDFESLGLPPNGAVVSMACLVFENDPYNVPKFQDLVDSAFYMSVDVKKQNRRTDKSVIDWWKKQSDEAKRLLLKPGHNSIADLYNGFHDYLNKNNFNKKDGQGWCRGASFDFPFLMDITREVTGERDTFKSEACFFWNQRDVRTAIEATLMKRGQANCPLPKGTLDGFIHHFPPCDIAKDVLMLIYSQRYALGLEFCPDENECDPLSL